MRSLLNIVFAFSGILWFTVLSAKEMNQPHIIIILIDDLGWNDLGFHGSDQIKTPNIDALAYSGMILNRHYVQPSCTPSRSALLTGYYPIHTGMQGYPLKAGENRNLPLKFKIQPEYLKDLGYKTHMVGKWHLGYQSQKNVPNRRGFDSFFGYYNGYVDYYKFGYNQTLEHENETTYFYGYDLHKEDEVYWTDMETYATTMFTERAVDIINNHDTTQPLYLYFSHLAVHTGDDEVGMEVPRIVDLNESFGHIKSHGRRAFAACLEELDKSVGEVVKALYNRHMLENSIILIASDNGGHTVSIDMPPNWSSNWPLAGTKFTAYEGGVRGAGLIWSPFLPGGVVNNDFLHISDWMPTFYSVAGGDPGILNNLDGINQWDALLNNTSIKRKFLLVDIDDKTGSESVIIDNRWKLVRGGLPNYGNYDYHWGWEENIKPNPRNDWNGIINSDAGRIIRSLKGKNFILNAKKMAELRTDATVKCSILKNNRPFVDEGFVEPSNTFRCPNYCLFDILNDPCELNPIKNNEILTLGEKFIEEMRKTVIRQKPTRVEIESNPERFGGVWMPWEPNNSAETFKSSLIHISIFIMLIWYFLAKRR